MELDYLQAQVDESHAQMDCSKRDCYAVEERLKRALKVNEGFKNELSMALPNLAEYELDMDLRIEKDLQVY